MPGSRALAGAALALLLAGVGLAALSAPPAEVAASAPPAWRLERVAMSEGQGLLRHGEAWVGHVPVARLLVREMVATLTWEDDVPGSEPDVFTLELVPPNGVPGPPMGEGGEGLLELHAPLYWGGPPRSGNLGTGDWSVRVYLRDAGDGYVAGLVPAQPDNANPFALRVDAWVWTRG